MNVATLSKRTFRLRGRSFFAMVLTPERPLDHWLADLDDRLQRAPNFLTGKPLVLDIAGLEFTHNEFALLVAALTERDIRILGVEGSDPNWLGLGLPPALSGGKDVAEGASDRPALSGSRRAALFYDDHVRSGQTIVNPDGDVVIVGSVSSGAEVLAAGSIHIYGAARGRIFAGMNSEPGARILCQRLEAELLAIDGYYLLAEELDAQLCRKPVQVWLDGQMLRLMALD